ncbi:MAG: hypothetical protein HY763_17280 [Planctomycetes bacterium]|nr:hypothetical protein [Planctomycetota bacterium]
MNQQFQGRSVVYLALALAAGFTQSARAGSHLWRVNELFSNADGTVQFIELHECCGAPAEHFIGGHDVFCDATGKQFVFPAHITGVTSFRYLLLGTAAFAALPGAPTPDYIIPPNFFSISGDTIRYSTTAQYDTFTFGPGVLPTNGVNCIGLTSYSPDQFVIGVNSPTNYNGDTGTVNAAGAVPAVSQWGAAVMALLVLTAGTLVAGFRRSAPA